MAASITDLLTQATNTTRPTPTTLTAIKNISATSLTTGSLTGWPTGTAVHFILYTIDTTGAKVSGSQSDWKGVVSGTTITNLTLKAGTDQAYGIGTIVEATPTAAWANDVVSWGTAQHNQDGTHANVTSTGTINASNVSSLQDASVALSTYRNESQFPFTASGGVWSGLGYGTTLTATMTAWVGYINGQRGTIASVATRTFTASKDTYIDVLNTSGVFTLVYTEVANNAASPALAANSMRIAIIVSGATIAAATSINQGQVDRVLPIASSIAYSVTDSLGNLIYNTTPSPTIIGYRQILGDFSTAITAATQITGLTCPVIIPSGRRVRITVYSWALFNSGASQNRLTVWDGVVGSGTSVGGATSGGVSGIVASGMLSTTISASGSKTYNAAVHTNTAGTVTFSAGAAAGFGTEPGYISVEIL